MISAHIIILRIRLESGSDLWSISQVFGTILKMEIYAFLPIGWTNPKYPVIILQNFWLIWEGQRLMDMFWMLSFYWTLFTDWLAISIWHSREIVRWSHLAGLLMFQPEDGLVQSEFGVLVSKCKHYIQNLKIQERFKMKWATMLPWLTSRCVAYETRRQNLTD